MVVLLSLVAVGFVGCLQFTHQGATTDIQKTASPSPPAAITVDRRIRVRLVQREPLPAVQVAVASAFKILDAATQRILYESANQLGPCEARPGPRNGIDIGLIHLPAAAVQIVPARDAAIVLTQGSYRGVLEIARAGNGVTLTNVLDVEAYLCGVLRGELPRSFHAESFKAQAVAARTYVLYQKQVSPPDRDYDVVDHEGSQMYLGARGEEPIAVHAVQQTRGEVCVWNRQGHDELFCTYYSSTCGGRSQCVTNVKSTAEVIPPLAGSVVCTDCSVSPQYRWKPVRISKAEVTRCVAARYPTVKRLGKITRLQPKQTTPEGRIIRIQLVGERGDNETLMGEDFRLCVGGHRLKSTNVTIADGGDSFVFSDGKGFGHGMGMCQYGMDAKARGGMNYRDILRTYYPGAEIKRIYE